MGKGPKTHHFADEDALFLAAMSGAGGDPLSSEDRLFEDTIRPARPPLPARRGAPGAPEAEPPAPALPEPAWLQEEDALFDAAMKGGALPPRNKRVPPSQPEEEHPRGIPARRTLLRMLRTGEMVPERILDLHGLTQEMARPQVRGFVRSAHAAGLRITLIVTGRGNHSAGDPVLRSLLPGWLKEDVGDAIHDVIRAPVLLGSEGAFVVVLRPT